MEGLPKTEQLLKNRLTSPLAWRTWSATPKVLVNDEPGQSFSYPLRKTTGSFAVRGIGRDAGMSWPQIGRPMKRQEIARPTGWRPRRDNFIANVWTHEAPKPVQSAAATGSTAAARDTRISSP